MWVWLGRILASVLSVVLLGTLIWLLLSLRHPVPLVGGFATAYRAPLPPRALTAEDRRTLERLATAGGGLFEPPSVAWFDASDQLANSAQTRPWDTLTKSVRMVRPGGPDNDMVVVYLGMVGTLDHEGQPCLAMPADGEGPGIRVAELLTDLRDATPASAGLLVVLDGCEAGLGWPLGIADGSFAPAVEAMARSSTIPRTWVLVSAGAGERSHGDPEDGGSLFATSFAEAIVGAADRAPFGNGDGLVQLRELATFLSSEVPRRSRLQFGSTQTPLLIPAFNDARGEDPAIAWAIDQPATGLVGGLRRWFWGSWGLETDASSRRSASVNSIDARGPRWWLAERWAAASRLRAEAVHGHPNRWQRYQQLLMRAEHLLRCGAAASEERIRTETLVERLEVELKTATLVDASRLPSVRINEWSSTPAEMEIAAAWRRDFAETLASVQSTPQKLVPPSTYPRAEWIGRCRAACDWLEIEAPRNPLTPDGLQAWLASLGRSGPDRLPEPIEVHTARMVARHLDDGVWLSAPDLPGRLLRLVGMSRRAALPDDVRSDRAIALVANRKALDEELRRAIDLMLLADPDSVSEARQVAAMLESRYEEIIRLGVAASTTVRLLDTVDDELPWLAAWWVSEARAAVRGDGAQPPAVEWLELLDSVADLRQVVDRSLGVRAEEAVIASIDETVAVLDEARSRTEEALQSLTGGYEAACSELVNAASDSPVTLGRIRRILDIPLLRGRRRIALWERAEALRVIPVPAPSPTEGTLPEPDLRTATAGWISWKDTVVHPVVPILAGDVGGAASLPTEADDVAVAVARQVDAINRQVSLLPETLGRLGKERAAATLADPDKTRADPYLESGDLLARRLASVTCFRNVPDVPSSVHVNFVAAWHDRLTTAASDAIDDFWTGVEPGDGPWYAETAEEFLTAASELVSRSGVSHGTMIRRAVEARLRSLSAVGMFGTVKVAPEVLTLYPSLIAADSPTSRTSLRTTRGVPSGLAALWFAESLSGIPIGMVHRVGNRSPDAVDIWVPLNVEADGGESGVSWKVVAAPTLPGNVSGPKVIDMIVWFRGHRVVVPLPVLTAGDVRTVEWQPAEPRPPTVTVRGTVPRQRSVAIVFDCSGSMGQRLLDGRTRLTAGRDALMGVLESMSKEGGWNVSLWLYGHRTEWSRSRGGRYTAGFTEEGKRQRDTAIADGKPFRLVPGNDVERVLDMQPLSPVQLMQIRTILDSQRPGGETPLYRAIDEVLRIDFATANPAPGHVVVVTDGANEQSGGTITTASDVQRSLSLVNVGRREEDLIRIDVIGFDMPFGGDGRQIRMQDLQCMAEESKGAYFDATDPRRLTAALERSMRSLRWQVQSPVTGRLTASLGDPITLPLPARGSANTYDVQMEAGQFPRRVIVSGGEALELFLATSGRLEFRRYTGGFEQGLRDSHADLPDPADPTRRWFIGAHMTHREGADVRFPISVQNNSADGFSPRPTAAWIEVTPRGDGGPIEPAYVFYDLTFEPGRPVPVLQLRATDWPAGATMAEVRAWVRFIDCPPTITVPLSSLPIATDSVVPVPGLEGTSLRIRVSRHTGDNELRVTVIEEHPPAVDQSTRRLRIEVRPGCRHAVHVSEPGAARIRHEFVVGLVDGLLPGDVSLLVTDREDIIRNAVGPRFRGGPSEPLIVPVSPR